MTIDKTELYKLYMEWVDKVADEYEWKTHFGPKEIVYAIARILEEHPELILNNKNKYDSSIFNISSTSSSSTCTWSTESKKEKRWCTS